MLCVTKKEGRDSIMNCPNCGKELNPGDKFCIACGTKIESSTAGDQAGAGNGAGTINNSYAAGAGNFGAGISFGSSKSMIRRYFFGFSDLVWLSVIVWIIFTALKMPFKGYSAFYGPSPFETFCTVVQVIAVIVFLGAIGLTIYMRVTGVGRNNVDMATQKAIEMLRTRAQGKFNVDEEQIKEVKPIFFAGMGAEPDDDFKYGTKKITMGEIKHKHFSKFSKIITRDPVYGNRIGLDGVSRYLLVQATLYAFTDTQLLVYTGNVDIATGMIYDELVSEIFYKDINGVTQEDVLKKFRAGIFRKQYYYVKYVLFDVCGTIKGASLDSRFAPDAEASLKGMESYIREKKY